MPTVDEWIQAELREVFGTTYMITDEDKMGIARAVVDCFVYGNGYMQREWNGAIKRLDPPGVMIIRNGSEEWNARTAARSSTQSQLDGSAHTVSTSTTVADEPEGPCCDYRDHGGKHPVCACPNHEPSELHPFGAKLRSGMTWKDIAMNYPMFVQWVVQRHGPLPDGEVKQEDYERYKAEYETET